MNWSLTIAEHHYRALHEWLVRTDQDEHAAFLLCGIASVGDDYRFLVREVVPVADEDFTLDPSGGHYRVAASAVARAGRLASDAGLSVVWTHSHPLQQAATFSRQDLKTHGRAAEALGAITGQPVGAVVLGLTGGVGVVSPQPDDPERLPTELSNIRVIGRRIRDLDGSDETTGGSFSEDRFARQVQLFGAAGQALLRRLKVGIIGLGGGGSLLAQMLAHLGVGTVLLLDFDYVDESNLSRIVGSTSTDAERATAKVEVAARLITRTDRRVHVIKSRGDIRYQDDARDLTDCDFLFLATDTLFARFAFNVLCHQYLIPGMQVGAKVSSDPETGPVVHVTARPVGPGIGCMTCAGAIPPDQLREEQLSDEERRAQRYIDTPDDDVAVTEASVITLNSIATSLATTDFLLMFTGLLIEDPLDGLVYYPRERSLRHRSVATKPGCVVCDATAASSVSARGDGWPLPLRPGRRGEPERSDRGWITSVLLWFKRIFDGAS